MKFIVGHGLPDVPSMITHVDSARLGSRALRKNINVSVGTVVLDGPSRYGITYKF